MYFFAVPSFFFCARGTLPRICSGCDFGDAVRGAVKFAFIFGAEARHYARPKAAAKRCSRFWVIALRKSCNSLELEADIVFISAECVSGVKTSPLFRIMKKLR